MVAEPIPSIAPTPGEPLSAAGGQPMKRAAARPSATRNASLSRASRRRQAALGNVKAMRHGAFAQVQAAADVATEIALTLVAYPGLHPIADRRLVEHLAETRVTVQRTLLAMTGAEGMTPTLTAFLAKMSPLEERLERQVYERERQRIAERAKGRGDGLERYRSGGGT